MALEQQQWLIRKGEQIEGSVHVVPLCSNCGAKLDRLSDGENYLTFIHTRTVSKLNWSLHGKFEMRECLVWR
ncbi:unnamed protein product [marine sediment metagenome]|uniref:Uncharacterized protein n=1 Tax=marine sediment metagenome TaxID=412755 RepID=X0X812_9ZZZZ